MGKKKNEAERPPGTTRKLRPTLTPEARESRMISLAMDLAEKQLMEGTASSQIIALVIKQGMTRERLERERLEKENELLRAKTESLQSQQRLEGLYEEAIKAFKRYSGQEQEGADDDDERE